MRLDDTENAGLTIFDKEGNIPAGFYFFYAKAGFGKTLAEEGFNEEFQKNGFTIICLSDVKDIWENAFAMFLPKKEYHLSRLKKDGTAPSTKKVLLYHPYTNNIPAGNIPKINFYGLALKDLGRQEFAMISESEWESETTRLLIDSANSINDFTGLHGFLHFIEEKISGKKQGEKLKRDWKNFGLRTTGGTAKSLVEVASFFQNFKKDYFLVPENLCPVKKLDWKKIIDDNEHYHIFSTKWIKDKKVKEFCIMALLNQIIEFQKNEKKSRKPILVYIPEIRYLTPLRPKGYKLFLADAIKQSLSIMRSLSVSFIGDSQVMSDVDEGVRNSATFTFYGELGGAKDYENITKSLKSSKEQSEQLLKMDVHELSRPSFLIQGEFKRGLFTPKFPSHCHAEEGITFEEMYREHNRKDPEKYPMQSYDSLKKEMKNHFESEEAKIREKAKREEKAEREAEEKKKREKEERKNLRENPKSEKKEKEDDKNKEALMKIAYETFNDSSLPKDERSYRAIGKKIGTTHSTAKGYIEDYEKRKVLQMQTDVP